MEDHRKYPCAVCGAETDLRGWFFVMRHPELEYDEGGMKREFHWWCRKHFLNRMFNLLPFACTDECHRVQQLKCGLQLDEEDRITWVQLEAMIRCRNEDTASPEDFVPKCPWCSQPMRCVLKHDSTTGGDTSPRLGNESAPTSATNADRGLGHSDHDGKVRLDADR